VPSGPIPPVRPSSGHQTGKLNGHIEEQLHRHNPGEGLPAGQQDAIAEFSRGRAKNDSCNQALVQAQFISGGRPSPR